MTDFEIFRGIKLSRFWPKFAKSREKICSYYRLSLVVLIKVKTHMFLTLWALKPYVLIWFVLKKRVSIIQNPKVYKTILEVIGAKKNHLGAKF